MSSNTYSKKYLIETAIGLQKVDNLSNSKYFIDLKNKYVAGKINVSQLTKFINSYYEEKKGKDVDEYKEADLVASRITDILSDDNFTFSPEGYMSIHRHLFDGIYDKAGLIRTYNFKKEE
ncbi:MAG: hypothetical protein MJ201_01160 [Mycoplasmoidaceae bacterium]|nr:hypothetical protein [Mycoplasmoidaceae bacterium]MCQ3914413.1 hypothetical protein [Mycoplasmoidaceae bacterium]